jgi:hypothetical protein
MCFVLALSTGSQSKHVQENECFVELRRLSSSLSYRMHPRFLVCLAAVALAGGCIHVKMDPIQVNAVVDVNVKVDRALDDFFGDLDKKSSTLTVPKS